MRPLVLTMGDPAGIGGELTLRSWLLRRDAGPCFVALDAPDRLTGLARVLGFDIPIARVDSLTGAAEVFRNALPVLPIRLAAEPVAGRPDPANAPAVVAAIERAAHLALAGEAGGMVT